MPRTRKRGPVTVKELVHHARGPVLSGTIRRAIESANDRIIGEVLDKIRDEGHRAPCVTTMIPTPTSRAKRLFQVTVRMRLKPGRDQVEVFRYVAVGRTPLEAIAAVRENTRTHNWDGAKWDASTCAAPAVLTAAYVEPGR